MIKFIDLQIAVRQLAAIYPDFQYKDQGLPSGIQRSCSYRGKSLGHHDEGTGCIFGEALKTLGVPNEKLEELDNLGGIRDVIQYSDIFEGATIDEVRWAYDVQRRQDDEFTWKEAVEVADMNTPSVLASYKACVLQGFRILYT